MQPNQKLLSEDGKQVALFPLQQIYVTQRDDENFSHEDWYYATDYVGYIDGARVYRCPCYAPVDIECIWINEPNCVALWQSTEKVQLANGMIDYLGLIVYHDNDIQNGLVQVGTKKLQGQEFNKTGTGGKVTGDHIHLETGYGKYETSTTGAKGTSEYKFHFTDYTACKRLHNYDALFINGTDLIVNPSTYIWKTYENGWIPDIPDNPDNPDIVLKKNKFPWVILMSKKRKLRKF